METPPADRSIILTRSGREAAHRRYSASTVQKDIAGKWSPGVDERAKEFGYARNPLGGMAKGPRTCAWLVRWGALRGRRARLRRTAGLGLRSSG